MVSRVEVMTGWDTPARLIRACFEDGTEVQITAYGQAKDSVKGVKEWRKIELEVATVGKS